MTSIHYINNFSQLGGSAPNATGSSADARDATDSQNAAGPKAANSSTTELNPPLTIAVAIEVQQDARGDVDGALSALGMDVGTITQLLTTMKNQSVANLKVIQQRALGKKLLKALLKL